MPDEPTRDPQAERRCPACWSSFIVPPNNPHKRYCCPACRVQDWRRRREHDQTQLLLDAALERIRAANAADAERREARRLRHALEERRTTMNPD